MFQNKEDMGFCDNCGMNAFPARPEFNTVLFVVSAILESILTIVMIAIIFILTWAIDVLLLIFIIFLNPYIIYYLLQPKKYCPKCRKELSEKNLAYEPFGDKKPEIFKRRAFELKKSSQRRNQSSRWHCPYCGRKIRTHARFCEYCGRKIEFSQ